MWSSNGCLNTPSQQTIKKYPMEAPVLCYYDESKPVPVQCDASQSGLGAVLLQDGQPDCYASRALTPTESQYKQEIVTNETNHEPLKSVFKKEIQKSPKRLQQMCLALQKYNARKVHRILQMLHPIANTSARQHQ